MMAADLSLDFWHAKLKKYERKITRAFWAFCRWARIIPVLSGKANSVISGDPEKDILLASSFHKSYVFCLLNYSDIHNSEFFRNAGGINKLHNLGWNSIISVDDVNKRVIWCMKEFHGLCAITPYTFIYSSLGHDQAKAYTDIETVKRSTSSIFSKTIPFKTAFSETKNILKDYLKKVS
jgi:hypothetical protein